MARSPNPREGSTLEGFLREQGLFEVASARAIKAVLAWQISLAMKHRKISKAEMARRMGTSRSALARRDCAALLRWGAAARYEVLACERAANDRNVRR